MKKIILFALLFLMSCTPKAIVKMAPNSRAPYPKLDANFVFIEEDTIEFDNFLGVIETKDNGFTIKCSYDSMKSTMIKKAESLGANCLVLQEHRKPNFWKTCHQLTAKMYWIDNPYDYESYIYWSEERKLKIRDFKGTTINRPFEAATFSTIGYSYKVNLWDGRLEVNVETFFDCKKSYLKRSESELKTLAHEQIHFDISEVYARKLFERFKNEITTFAEMTEKGKGIYDEVINEMILKQDEYDSEVYANRDLEKKWNAWVKQKLEASKEFAYKTFKGEKVKQKKVRKNANEDNSF